MSKLKIVLLPLFILLSASGSAKELSHQGNMLMANFFSGCMIGYREPQTLKTRLNKSLPKVPAAISSRLAMNGEGEGWYPRHLNEAILILNDAGPCSIFVRRWNDPDYATTFEKEFRLKLPILELRQERSSSSPMNSRSWAVYPTGPYKEALEKDGKTVTPLDRITLSISEQSDAPFQLVITVSSY